MQSTTRRNFCCTALAVAAAVCGTGAFAQTAYPSKPIKLIVPFAAAGSTDILARTLANALSRELGQSVIVDNRPGASGNIGAEAVARATPDGYTLLYTSTNLTANPAQMAVPYDVAKDFAPISRVAFLPLVLIKSSAVQAKTVPELVSAIRANPGKYNFSSSGVGGAPHMAGELFKAAAHLDLTHVPYNGAGPALNDVAAGLVQLTFTTVASAQAMLKAGKVAAVAVAGERRLASLPQVPTFRESGIEGLEMGTMNGLLAPAKTPQPIIDKIYAAVKKAAEREDFKNQFVEQGADLVLDDPAKFGAYIRSDLQRWKDLMARTSVTK
ncbi:MAG TPA: tripartite tricarboxylate transporter substrate binding protein [Alicycliphilus sp.]|nr:tripartite tricarboxylate transporter substrate binding protein [Alicycliphilus sp.]